jgi:hypothetical protein
MLDRELKTFEVVTFYCQADEEAAETAGALLRWPRETLPVVGFELRQDDRRILFRLENS